MTWRYVLCRESTQDGYWFTVREAYEGDDGSLGWTEDPICPGGESWMELADDLARMASDINGPVLDLTLDPPQLVAPWEVR